MIILEGVDKTGKSTVARRLQSLLPGWSYKHFGVPPKGTSPFDYHAATVFYASPKIIIDRLFWSESAYGRTYRDGCGYTPHEWRLMELALMGQNAQIIRMNSDSDSLAERWRKDEKDFDVMGLTALQLAFDEVQAESKLENRTYNLFELVDSKCNPTELLESIATEEFHRAHRADLTPNLVIGNRLNKEFIILGEAPGNFPDRRPTVPFGFGFSSEWLWRAIDELGLDMSRGVIVNASTFRNPQHFTDFIGLKSKPLKILCLGDIAEDLARGVIDQAYEFNLMNAKILKVWHPNYARRFRHSKFDEWTSQIGDFLKEFKQ